jgi:hypothetical protein
LVGDTGKRHGHRLVQWQLQHQCRSHCRRDWRSWHFFAIEFIERLQHHEDSSERYHVLLYGERHAVARQGGLTFTWSVHPNAFMVDSESCVDVPALGGLEESIAATLRLRGGDVLIQ